jgi:hypothetical protein
MVGKFLHERIILYEKYKKGDVIMYQCGQLMNVSIENYKGLVKYAIDHNKRNYDIIWLEDKNGDRYLTLNQIELLKGDFKIIDVESIDDCIMKLQVMEREYNEWQEINFV